MPSSHQLNTDHDAQPALRSLLNIATVLCLSMAAITAIAQQAVPKIELLSKPCSEKTSAKIAVFFSGVTHLNGKPIFVPELSKALKDKSKFTEVCYYRERPESAAAPPQTEQVLNAVIQERLPVAFYWDFQFQKLVSFKE